MAIIRNARGATRPWYSRRTYIVSTWRGIARASGWRKRGPIYTSAWEAGIRERLREITETIKRLHPREIVPTYTAITNHNRRVKGQQGTAAMRYEDWETMRLAGRLFAFHLDDGTVLWPAAAYEDISSQLDWISDTPGALLVRGNTYWGAAIPCAGGKLFQIPNPPVTTNCCPLVYPFIDNP